MKKYIILTLLLFAAAGITKAQQTYFTPGVPPGSTGFSPTYRFTAGTTDSLNNFFFSNGSKWYQSYTAAQANVKFQRKLTFLNGLTTTGFNITLGGGINQQTIFSIGATNNMQWLRSDILSNFSQQNTGIFRINLTGFNNTTNNKLLTPVNVEGVTRFAFKTTADTLGVTVGNANSGASGAIKGQVGAYVTSGTAFHSLHFKSKPLGIMKSYPASLADFKVFYSDSTIVAGGDTLNGNNTSTVYHMHESPSSGFYSTFGLPNRGDGFNHTFYTFGVYKQNPALSTAHLHTAVAFGDDSVKLSDVADTAYFMRNRDANSKVYLHSNTNIFDNLPTGTAAYSVNIDAGGKLIKGTAVTPGSAVWGSITGTLSDQTDLQTALDAKYAKLAPTSVKTSSYTAAANELVVTNTTSGNVPIILPTAPANGTLVDVKMVIQGGTNTTTVTCGGSDVFNKSAGSTTLTLSLLNQGVLLHYNAGIWYVLADDLPLAKLVTSVTGGQGITPTTLQTGAVTFAVDTAFLHSSLSPYTGMLMSYIGSGPARKWSIYVDTTLIAAKSYVNATYAPISGSANYIQNQSSGAQTSANYNIDGNGVIGGYFAVGAISGTGTSLRISRNMTGATTYTGLSSLGQIQSDVTSTANYNATSASTAATSFTISVLNHYVAQQGIFGSGSVVTTQNAFNVTSGLTGATNNRAFAGQLAAATGSWNLYMSGTAQNYLAGNLGLGSQTPGSTLMLSGNRTLSGAFSTSVGAQVAVSGGTITDNTTADGATLANVVINSFSASPIAFTNGTSTGVTATKLSTVYIGGAPTLTAPNTATASYALDVNSGNVKMGAYGTGIAHYSSTGVMSSSTIATADIAANAMTYPKIQAGTATRIFGTGTGTAFEEMTALGTQGVSVVFGAASLTYGLGAITPTSVNSTMIPASKYQTPIGTAGTDSIVVKHSGGVMDAISPTYYAAASTTAITQGSGDITAQTAAGNIATFTVGAATATFNISAYLNVTAISTDVIQVQVTYTDENSNAQTVSYTTLNSVSDSNYNPVTIRAKNGTVITVKTNLTVGAGSVTFDAGARITQL